MTAPKFERRKEARPTEIVAAALHQFAERGYAATRLDDVAKAAKVSKGTLYLYFPNKEELFKAVVRQAVLPNLAQATRLVERHRGSTADLLRRLMRRLMRMLETEVSAVPKIVVSEAGNFPAIAEFYMDAVVKHGLGLIARILQRGIARGEFRAVDIPTTLPLVVAPFLMMAVWKHSLARHAPVDFDRRMVLENHVEMLIRGLSVEKP